MDRKRLRKKLRKTLDEAVRNGSLSIYQKEIVLNDRRAIEDARMMLSADEPGKACMEAVKLSLERWENGYEERRPF